MSERFGTIIEEPKGQRFGTILEESEEPKGERFGTILEEPQARFGTVIEEPKAKRAVTRRERRAARAAQKTISELEQMDPRDLSPEQEARLREAYGVQMDVAEADRANADADLRAAENEMSITEKLGGVSMDVLESGLGVGDEAGAVYNILSGKADNWDEGITMSRELLDEFEERNPMLSKFATAAGLAGGLMVPGATAAKIAQGAGKASRIAKGTAIGSAEGAAYGALSGRGEEGRTEGAMLGAALGGALGVVGGVIANKTAVAKEADEAATAAEQAKRAEEQAEAAKKIVDEADPADRELVKGVLVADDEATALQDLYLVRDMDDDTIASVAEVQVAELFATSPGMAGKSATEVAEILTGRAGVESSALAHLPPEPRLVAAIEQQAKRLGKASADELDEIRGDVLTRHGVTDYGKGDFEGSTVKWVNDKAQRVVMPITTQWRKWTGEGFAGKMERALVHSLPKKAELDKVTEDINPLFQAVEKSGAAKAHLLNATNVNLPERVQQQQWQLFYQRAAAATGRTPDEIRGLVQQYDEARDGVVAGYNRVIGETASLAGQGRLHAQKVPPNKRKRITTGPKSAVGRDEALQAQQRGILDEKAAAEYQNPYYTDNRWLRERIQDTNVAQSFRLRPATADELESVQMGDYVRNRIIDKAEEIGVKGEGLEEVGRLADATLVSSLEGVGPLLSILRSTNIATGIANPKSAALNFSEPMIMAMEHDMVDIMRAYGSQDGIQFTARELGLAAVQAGDELRRLQKANADGVLSTVDEAAQSLANTSMKLSGFEASTLYTQNIAMQAAINKATRIAKGKNGKVGKAELDKFDAEYGKWYTKTQQVNLLRALNKLDNNPKAKLTDAEMNLVKDFQLMALNEFQPLTAMGRSYVNNKYPLARPFLLFTTYTTRMHDAIARQASKHVAQSRKYRKSGHTAKANAELAKAFWSYTGRLMYSQALYAVTNQLRQHVFGQGLRTTMTQMDMIEDDGSKTREYDRFDGKGLLMDFLLSVPSQAVGGLLPNNEYAYRQSISAFKKGEVGRGVLKLGEEVSDSLMVPTAILFEAVNDSLEQEKLDPLLKRTPVIGPAIRIGYRYGED